MIKRWSFTLLTLIVFGMVHGQKNSSKVLYEELTPKEFRQRIAEAPIAYLPLGTIEWHGEHLPLGADGLQSKSFLETVAKEVGGIVLPIYFLGPDMSRVVDGKQLYGMDFYRAKEHGRPEQQLDGSAYWISDSLFSEVVEATLVQLKRAGFKIVVYHGHGPSTNLVKKRSEDWQKKYDIKMFNCWGGESSKGYGIMTDHAAMNETSLLMAMYPELVQMESLPSDTTQWPLGVLGKDPRIFASPEVGIKSINDQKERMGKILRKALSDVQNCNNSPIKIELAQPGFATFTNEAHPENRIGYRFHEHHPIRYGHAPLSNQEANINMENIDKLESDFSSRDNVFVYSHKIEKNEYWVEQIWRYYLQPVRDGLEILMVVQTYEEGLPEYYGIQQCFRMSGHTNEEWRKRIANTPAFSEYDLWEKDSLNRRSLTYILRDNKWEVLPALIETVGARTPLGIEIDNLRTDNNLMSEVGPYKAKMLNPIDNGLITRTDIDGRWICGIYWQGTSHVTNHHPADCLHSIVNIGNIPPYSKKAIRGKIYWYKGSKDSLLKHFKMDFID